MMSMVLYLTSGLLSQVPDTLWSRIHSISPNGDIDEGKCVRETADGGYIITGSTVPDGMVSHIDVLLLKTDAEGNIQWTRTYGNEFVDDGFAVEPLSDGGYIIAGRALLFSDTTVGNYNVSAAGWPPFHSDGWLLKTDANGDTVWTSKFGGEGHDYCTSVKQTGELDYIMAGTFNSENSYPSYEVNEEYQPAESQAWLLKTDSDGDTLWTRKFRHRSHANSVIVTSDGGYLLAGWVFPDQQSNQSDVFLVKTDEQGDTVWTRIIGGSQYEIGFSVCEVSGGYVICGQTKPVGLPYDALLIKTNEFGEVLWMNLYGGTGSDAAYTVEASQQGLFVTGTTNGNWWIHQGDMWAFETDLHGNVLWERIYNMRLCDYGFCGIQNSEGDFILSGMLSHGFGGDLWLAKLGFPSSGIDDEPEMVDHYILHQNFPNPFNPSTTIEFQLPLAGQTTLKIYNIMGQEIATIVSDVLAAGTHRYRWDIAEFTGVSSGIYFYRLDVKPARASGKNFTITRKMMLMK